MLTLFSPAKLNLFFRVLRKREDGYHEIASLYQAIDLGDTLTFALNDHDLLTCTDPALSCGNDNLVNKAIALFRKKTGLSDFHVRCHLEKNIPIQTGVGGGSSNAATTLYACNELAGRPVTLRELAQWAGEIGSDISFFFSSGSAYCTGRGEIFEEAGYTPLFPQPCFLARPAFGLSTPAVYKACQISELPARDPKEVLTAFLRGQPVWFNDLEPAACRVSPEFQNTINQLRSSGFSDAVLTGSGSGVFCFGRKEPPNLGDVRFYPIRSIARSPHAWYELNKDLYATKNPT